MKQAIEYVDALVTVELAVMFAMKEGRKVNEVIRNTIESVVQRTEDKKVRAIFNGLAKQTFPLGALRMMRRGLDEAVG